MMLLCFFLFSSFQKKIYFSNTIFFFIKSLHYKSNCIKIVKKQYLPLCLSGVFFSHTHTHPLGNPDKREEERVRLLLQLPPSRRWWYRGRKMGEQARGQASTPYQMNALKANPLYSLILSGIKAESFKGRVWGFFKTIFEVLLIPLQFLAQVQTAFPLKQGRSLFVDSICCCSSLHYNTCCSGGSS